MYNVIQNSEYFETILSKRLCILLIGDSINDAKMIDDGEKFSYEQVIVIRIGFLNEKVSIFRLNILLQMESILL